MAVKTRSPKTEARPVAQGPTPDTDLPMTARIPARPPFDKNAARKAAAAQAATQAPDDAPDGEPEAPEGSAFAPPAGSRPTGLPLTSAEFTASAKPVAVFIGETQVGWAMPHQFSSGSVGYMIQAQNVTIEVAPGVAGLFSGTWSLVLKGSKPKA